MLVRFRAAWIAALAFAGLGAALEAHWAAAVATAPLDAPRAWFVALGLLVPSTFVAAVVVSALWPLLGARARRAPESPAAPREPRVFLPVLGFGAAAGVAFLAQLALGVWSLGLTPWRAAVLLALAAALVSRLLSAGFLALARSPRLLALGAHLPEPLSLLLGVLAFAGPVAYGISSGTPNGDGGFWDIFAVLARQELDLRPPLLVLGLFLAAYAGAWQNRGGRGALLLAAGFAALAWTATAFRLLDDESLALALERGGALSRISLRYQRAATDRDGDGVPVLFGGHDCDDRRGDVYPGAVDIPGNGVDEDCSGGDAERLQLALVATPPGVPPAAIGAAGDESPPRELRPDEAAGGTLHVPSDLNVILITVDTLRHDLGYAGYARPISPNLDRLAARSVVFDRAYSLASYTGKSIGPLMIGKYPSETHRGFFHFNRFGRDETFVQERLQAAGVRTLSVQGHWYFTPEYGIGRGFDVLDLSASPEERLLEGDKTVNGDKLTNAAIARLSLPENTSGRFFLWVHYLDPHADYIRHEGFDFGPRGRDLYDSEVAFTDQQIGRLLDFVAASAFGARTAIIVTSDHGEAFGEHGMWRHGYELWEALVKVPLIAYVPGAEPHHVGARRSGVDLAPTLLELFGVPLPGGDERLSGKPLGADIMMPEGHVPEDRPVFIDMSAGPFNEERQALIQSDIKLIMCTGRVIGLYDLGRDPDETQDLRSDRALLSATRGQFVAFQRQLRWVRVNPTDSSAAP